MRERGGLVEDEWGGGKGGWRRGCMEGELGGGGDERGRGVGWVEEVMSRWGLGGGGMSRVGGGGVGSGGNE